MRAAGQFALYFLSVGVGAYALLGYGALPLGSLVHPDMRTGFVAHPAGIYLHVFAASVAILTGPFQLSTGLRKQWRRLHRWAGRAYLAVGVLAGGMSGLYIAQFAFGGLAARLGFTALAACWLYTGLRAYLAIRRGAPAEHRRWMVRNFSLTFAAVMLRLYIPVSVIAGVRFDIAYPVIAWLCWVPNLVFAEWRYNRPHDNTFNMNAPERQAG